jgi:hypothetical protein
MQKLTSPGRLRGDGTEGTGVEVPEQSYFNERIDIHHVFPRAWCEKQGIGRGLYDSIVNKTALSAETNRFLGGDAPSTY